MTGQEHALVRSPAATVVPVAPTMAAAGPPLTARVLEVHAAYRCWCEGTALPGDTALLGRAGGTRLLGAVACTPKPAPRPLIPATGPAPRRRLAGDPRRKANQKWSKPFTSSRVRRLVQTLQAGVFGRFLHHGQSRWNSAWRLLKGRFGLVFGPAEPFIVLPPARRHKRSKRAKTPSFCYILSPGFEKKFGRELTGFGALGGLLTVALLVAGPLTAVPALAMELPVGSRFLSRGSDGWFWYERCRSCRHPTQPSPVRAQRGG